jgi:hypothetical protein
MKILLSVILGLFSGFFAVMLMGLFILGARFGGVVSEEIKRSERWPIKL